MSSVQPPFLDAPRLVPILHADDCGLSAGITDGIVTCYDRGWLRRTSVVVNGAGWEHAVAVLQRRPRLSVALHLNVFEGRPLSAPTELDLLVDRRGRFNRGFAALWAHGLAGAGAARLRAQLRLELRRQIERFLEAFAYRGPLSVDGHVHYHVLPPVFQELLALCDEYPIGSIRLPREPLYWPLTRGAPRPAMVNVVKNVVLRALSRRAEPALHARFLRTSEAFVGVLGTGAMTLAHVRAALDHLRRAGTSGTVEILFHPGRALPSEASLWSDRPELGAFYFSANRDREAELLCSAALGHLLRDYGAVADDAAALTLPGEVSG
jgi:chitin disaccharide deacetylase